MDLGPGTYLLGVIAGYRDDNGQITWSNVLGGSGQCSVRPITHAVALIRLNGCRAANKANFAKSSPATSSSNLKEEIQSNEY